MPSWTNLHIWSQLEVNRIKIKLPMKYEIKGWANTGKKKVCFGSSNRIFDLDLHWESKWKRLRYKSHCSGCQKRKRVQLDARRSVSEFILLTPEINTCEWHILHLNSLQFPWQRSELLWKWMFLGTITRKTKQLNHYSSPLLILLTRNDFEIMN